MSAIGIRSTALFIVVGSVGLMALTSCQTGQLSKPSEVADNANEPNRHTFDQIFFDGDGGVDWVSFDGSVFRIRKAVFGHAEQAELLKRLQTVKSHVQSEATDPAATELHLHLPDVQATRILSDPSKDLVEVVAAAFENSTVAIAAYDVEPIQGPNWCASFDRYVSSNPPQREKISLHGDRTVNTYNEGSDFNSTVGSSNWPGTMLWLDELQWIRTLAAIYRQTDWNYRAPPTPHVYGYTESVTIAGRVNGEEIVCGLNPESQAAVKSILRRAAQSAKTQPAKTQPAAMTAARP